MTSADTGRMHDRGRVRAVVRRYRGASARCTLNGHDRRTRHRREDRRAEAGRLVDVRPSSRRLVSRVANARSSGRAELRARRRIGAGPSCVNGESELGTRSVTSACRSSMQCRVSGRSSVRPPVTHTGRLLTADIFARRARLACAIPTSPRQPHQRRHSPGKRRRTLMGGEDSRLRCPGEHHRMGSRVQRPAPARPACSSPASASTT